MLLRQAESGRPSAANVHFGCEVELTDANAKDQYLPCGLLFRST